MFSGIVKTRSVVAILLISGQSATAAPICVSFGGNGDKMEVSKVTPMVSDNSVGITCTKENGALVIPAFGTGWGNYRVVLLDENLNVSIK